MIQLKHSLSGPALLAILTTCTALEVQAGGIYLQAGSNALTTSGNVQYSSGPDILPSAPNAGFFPTSSAGSTISQALAIGLTGGALSSTSTASAFGTAIGAADVSLATGLFHLSANSNGTIVGCGGTCATTDLSATSSAGLTDLVTWAITDNAPTATIGVKFHLSGAVTTEAGASGAFSDRTCFSFGPDAFGFNGSNTGFAVDPTACGAGGNGFTLINQTATGFDASASFTVTNGMQSRLIAQILLSCSGGDNCDFTHTGAVSFVLPSDVTYTSSSGVLLTQTGGTGTPEPASVGLLGGGLVLIAYLRRRALRAVRSR